MSYPLKSNTLLMSPYFNGVIEQDLTTLERFFVKWFWQIKQDLIVLRNTGSVLSRDYVLRKVLQYESLPVSLTYLESWLLVTYLFMHLRRIEERINKPQPLPTFFDVRDYEKDIKEVLEQYNSSTSPESTPWETEHSIDSYLGNIKAIYNKDNVLCPYFEERQARVTSLTDLPEELGRRPFLHVIGNNIYIVSRFDNYFNNQLKVFRTNSLYANTIEKLFDVELRENEVVLFSRFDVDENGRRVLYVNTLDCDTNVFKLLKLDIETRTITLVNDLYFPTESAFGVSVLIESLFQTTRHSYSFVVIVRGNVIDNYESPSVRQKLFLCINTSNRQTINNEFFHLDIITEIPGEVISPDDPFLVQVLYLDNFIVLANLHKKMIGIFNVWTKEWTIVNYFNNSKYQSGRFLLVPSTSDEFLVVWFSRNGYYSIVPLYMTLSGIISYVDTSKLIDLFCCFTTEEQQEIALKDFITNLDQSIDIVKLLLDETRNIDPNLCNYVLRNAFPPLSFSCITQQVPLVLHHMGTARGLYVETFMNNLEDLDLVPSETTHVDVSKEVELQLGSSPQNLEGEDTGPSSDEVLRPYFEYLRSMSETLNVSLLTEFKRDVPIVMPVDYKKSLVDPRYLFLKNDYTVSREVYVVRLPLDRNTFESRVELSQISDFSVITELAHKIINLHKSLLISSPECIHSWCWTYGSGTTVLLTPYRNKLLFTDYKTYETYPLYTDRLWSDNDYRRLLKACLTRLENVYKQSFSCNQSNGCTLQDTITEFGDWGSLNSLQLSYLENMGALRSVLETEFHLPMDYIDNLDKEALLNEILYYVNLYLGEKVDVTLVYNSNQIPVYIDLMMYVVPIHSRSTWVEVNIKEATRFENTVCFEEMISLDNTFQFCDGISVQDYVTFDTE